MTKKQRECWANSALNRAKHKYSASRLRNPLYPHYLWVILTLKDYASYFLNQSVGFNSNAKNCLT